MLSTPGTERSAASERQFVLEVDDLQRLPERSIIEVKLSATDFSYYRKDGIMWTKIAESNNPFTIEVFSYGLTPLRLGLVEEDSTLCFAL
jgi:hypothetical protein